MTSVQVLQNIELENALLKTELALHQKEELIKVADNRNNRLQKELVHSKLAATRAVKQFERKTAESKCFILLYMHGFERKTAES